MLFCVAHSMAASTSLRAPVMVTDGSAALDGGNYSAPTTADWDNDGSEDLLVGVGSSDSGKLRLYSNLGSNAERVFDGFFKLKSGGVDITDPAGG